MQNLRNKWLEDNKEQLNAGGKYTKSTLFLLPILDVYYKDFIFAGKEYLINCHLNLDKSELIVILHNEEDFEPITSIIYRLINDSLFLKSSEDNENREIILSFDLKKGWMSDLNKFIKGEYSLLSEQLKKKIVKCYGKGSRDDHRASMWDAIYPSDEKKNALIKYLGADDVKITELTEVMDKPTMTIEEYKNLKQLQEIYGVKQSNTI